MRANPLGLSKERRSSYRRVRHNGVLCLVRPVPIGREYDIRRVHIGRELTPVS